MIFRNPSATAVGGAALGEGLRDRSIFLCCEFARGNSVTNGIGRGDSDGIVVGEAVGDADGELEVFGDKSKIDPTDGLDG